MFTRVFWVMIFCCSLSYASFTSYTDIHDFAGTPTDGANSNSSLFQASNGLVYGMAQFGGTFNSGVIFSFDPANVAGTYTIIHSFSSSPDGASTPGSLFQASNGLIYGMTQFGGMFLAGTIFSFDPANVAGTYTIIHNFSTSTDGQEPFGSLFQASNGLIYGMTQFGGMFLDGTIFSFDPANVAGTYTIIHNFGSGTDGQVPFGSLFQASNGLIYGMTQSGGTFSHGIIFSFDPANVAGTYTIIHNFGTGTDGADPTGSLFQASNGLIYGMTQSGGTFSHGIIFLFDPANVAGTYANIHNFGSGTDGSGPFGSLFQASNGLIYGMTQFGGMFSHGIIFSFDPANVAGTYANIHSFGSGTDGSRPFGSLFQAANGLLYGTAFEKGAIGSPPGNGMMFSIFVPLAERAFRRSSAPGGYRPRGR